MQKLHSFFISIILALFLLACDPSDTPPNTINANLQANVKENTSDKTQVLDTEKNTLAGHYIYGPEVDVFQPCNQSKAYWVIGQEPLLSSMVAQYGQLITEPYEQVFIIVTGDYLAKATDGFAMDYDGQIRINSLIKMSKSTKTDCSN